MRYLSLVLALSLSCPVFAATHRKTAATTQVSTLHESTATPSRLTLAFAGRFFNYREVVNGKTFDSESGFLPGAEVGYERPIGTRGWVFNADAVGLFGNTAYDGGTWHADGSPGQPLKATTHNVVADFGANVGYDLTRERSHHWVPYLGVGGHFWARDLSDAPGGYDERYGFIYIPIGVRYQHNVSRRLAVAADLSGRWNLGGWIGATHFQNGAHADVGTLGMAFGARAQVPVTINLQRGFNLSFVPYFEYFGIGQGGAINIYNPDGTLATVGQEPDSHSFFYGFNAATQVTF